MNTVQRVALLSVLLLTACGDATRGEACSADDQPECVDERTLTCVDGVWKDTCSCNDDNEPVARCITICISNDPASCAY